MRPAGVQTLPQPSGLHVPAANILHVRPEDRKGKKKPTGGDPEPKPRVPKGPKEPKEVKRVLPKIYPI